MKTKGMLKMIMYSAGIFLLLYSCSPSGSETTTPPATDTVIISGMKFHPEELYVNKWDTVVWINQDLVAHDVTAFPGKEWTSDTIAVDHSWKKEIGKSINYFCSIHPTMKGKVILRQ